jgi:hypothetical protein
MEHKIFHETLSSCRTEALYIGLSIIFCSFFLLRWSNVSWDGLTITFLVFFVFFLFYAINYKTLKILITSDILQLTFGIFTWKVALADIQTCYIDENSILRYGGAGIHFMYIKGKYRAFFNFLEYSRVVITLRKKKGPVREIAFSTKKPEQVMELLRV